MQDRITPELLLHAYAVGLFPMAESRDSAELHWVDPDRRGVFPLDSFRISRSLGRTIRSGRFTVTTDRAFAAVMAGCADREETWINPEIHQLYGALHDEGFAHSLEVWQGEELVGGVYGIALGAAFFGESMFSRRTDASKLALAYLVDRLRLGGFTLFDTQFLTPHLASLGAVEISRRDYRARLSEALAITAGFNRAGRIPTPQELMQRKSHTS